MISLELRAGNLLVLPICSFSSPFAGAPHTHGGLGKERKRRWPTVSAVTVHCCAAEPHTHAEVEELALLDHLQDMFHFRKVDQPRRDEVCHLVVPIVCCLMQKGGGEEGVIGPEMCPDFWEVTGRNRVKNLLEQTGT